MNLLNVARNFNQNGNPEYKNGSVCKKHTIR